MELLYFFLPIYLVALFSDLDFQLMHSRSELVEFCNTIIDFYGNPHFMHISGLRRKYLILLQTGWSQCVGVTIHSYWFLYFVLSLRLKILKSFFGSKMAAFTTKPVLPYYFCISCSLERKTSRGNYSQGFLSSKVNHRLPHLRDEIFLS